MDTDKVAALLSIVKETALHPRLSALGNTAMRELITLNKEAGEELQETLKKEASNGA